MTSNSSSHDIIHNKINVLLAQNQRFVASWPSLQQKCKEQSPNVKSEAQVEKEEQEIFTPMPDLLGFGASEAKDGIMRRDGASSNEKLLEQLMGKGYAKRQEKRTKGADQLGGATMPAGSKPRPAPVKRAADSASEDEGRTAFGKSRQGGKHSDVQLDDEPMEDSMAKGTEPEAQGLGLRPQKKANNYLDEVLADRAQQKRKKSRKKRKRGASEQDS